MSSTDSSQDVQRRHDVITIHLVDQPSTPTTQQAEVAEYQEKSVPWECYRRQAVVRSSRKTSVVEGDEIAQRN